jgi:hypothetical protein
VSELELLTGCSNVSHLARRDQRGGASGRILKRAGEILSEKKELMYAQPAVVAVRTSLASIADKTTLSGSDAAQLHERLCVAVDELRSVGWPVERIIVRLKEVAQEVGFRPPQNTLLGPAEIERRKALWDEMIKNCIEQYYGSRAAR